MTQRFEQQGKQVTVTWLTKGISAVTRLTDEAALLPDEPRYWLREIILIADGEPWLAGRTVAPESTLCGPELALQQLGQTPLGRYLFTSSTLTAILLKLVAMQRCGGVVPPAAERQTPAADRAFLPASPLALRGRKMEWSLSQNKLLAFPSPDAH